MEILGRTSSGLIAVNLGDMIAYVPDDPESTERQAIAAWEAEGNVIPAYSEETPTPTITDYENAIQNLVDSTAREKQFRDGVTLASYIGSTKPKWAAEAQAFVAWRDYVWTSAYAELEKVQNGEREQPSIEAIIEELPKITWPST
jgi:hypothetical protein